MPASRPLAALVLSATLAILAGCRPAAEAAAPAPAPGQPSQPPALAPAAAAARVEDPKAVYRVPIDDTPLRGPADALVTIVEASDFECPFCRAAQPTLEALDRAYPGKLRFSFRHNPLPNHPMAVPAALLAEEARLQGGDSRFWAVRDRLMALPSLDRAALEAVAAEVGLPEGTVKRALEANRLERLRRDQNLLYALGARATPTFFVNGRKLVGAQPLEAFKALVDEELAKAGALARAGARPAELYARIVQQGASAPVLVAAPAAPAAGRPADAEAARVAPRPDDPATGPAAAPVTIVLFSDFQCPFCSKVGPTLKQVAAAHPADVRVVWKHQPLDFHPQALPAARLAEAARLQGKFWEMHDRLFADQAGLGPAAWGRHAAALGLDAARLERDAASEAVARRIAEDRALAGAVGAGGTPTMFVNCRRLVGAQPPERLEALVAEELRKAGRLRAAGVAGAALSDRLCADNVAAAPPPAPPAPPRTDVAVPLRADDPSRGGARPKVTVVVFSDFQCPFCQRALPALAEVERRHGADLRLVFKHLPLSFHPQARPAALAAEAARQQGRFWEMHDRLFASQQALGEATSLRLAAELGLDLGRFEAALAAPETRRRVEEDAAAAAAAGVSGTPTFVVAGEVVVGAGGLAAAVERHLEKARLAGR